MAAHLAGETTDRDLTWLNQSWDATLSRDGTRVLFSDGTTGENYGVVWRKTDGSPIVRLGEGDSLAWSPDETWALAQIYTPPQLVLYPMGAGEPVRLKRGAIAQYQGAFWFPDGKSLSGRRQRARQADASVPPGCSRRRADTTAGRRCLPSRYSLQTARPFSASIGNSNGDGIR